MTSDFLLQTTHQSLTHRLWRYADAKNWKFYTEGFVSEAVELGPCTDRAGPCLVHYKGSQLSAAQLNAWLHTGPGSSMIVRAYWLGGSPSVAAGGKEQLLQQLLAAGPPLDGGPLRLQCFPRTLEAWLGDQLPASFNLQPVNPRWALHIVHFEEQQQYRYHLQPAAELYNFAPLRGKRVPDQLCKAAGKLAEALTSTGLHLTQGVALDLGAAPGGWTHVLAQHAQRVIAVDPAELDPRALLPNVTHFCCKAEDAVERIHQLVGPAGLDLLVSDVNRHPKHVVEMLRPLLPLLRPGAAIIMTLKFFGRGAGREDEWQQRLAEELGEGYERVQLLWLLANTQHEQTCIAFKKPAPAAGLMAAAADEPAAAATLALAAA